MIFLSRTLHYCFWLVIYFSPVAFSAPRCEVLFDNRHPSQFETQILNSWPAIKKLRLQAQDILSIEKRLSTGGAYASGILRVRTAEGVFALKVFNEGYLARRIGPTLLIQNALADRGLAPRVHGLLTAKEVEALAHKFPQLDILMMGDDVSIAVLMDEVQVVSHLNHSSFDFIPNSWDQARLESRVREIESVFGELRIPPPEDLQLIFDQQDRLLLLDFDRYVYFSKDQRVYGEFSPAGEMSVGEYAPLFSNLRHQPEFQITEEGDFKVNLRRLRKTLGLSPQGER